MASDPGSSADIIQAWPRLRSIQELAAPQAAPADVAAEWHDELVLEAAPDALDTVWHGETG